MEIITDRRELSKYLDKISKIFDVSALAVEEIENHEIIDYYQKSELGYRFFHSPEGSIHMALNYNGVFSEDGYYEQAKIVNGYIEKLKAKQVLELGSGKGFNSIFLAKKNPSVFFTGIDLTPSHVTAAQRAAQSIENVRFEIGDFQSLEFTSEAFDMAFEVESVCHALDMELALSEIHRVLRKGGEFVMFDGFRKSDFDKLDKDLKLACKLTEISMAVGRPLIIDDFLSLIEKVGFSLVDMKDISTAIMPNLSKFQVLARGYFKFPSLAKSLLGTLPPYLVKNAVAGLLMPFTIYGGAQGYYQITLKRR